MWDICLYHCPKVEYFEVPWPDWLIQTKKMHNFGMLPMIFSPPKGAQGKALPLEIAATVYNKDIWGIMSEIYIYL